MKALLLILLAAAAVTAQKPAAKPCSLTVEQSPEVRGLKLGQAFSVLTDLFDNDRLFGTEADDIGLRRPFVIASYRHSERLQGIERLSLSYLDDMLASFQINYNSDTKWQSDEHFAAAIAEQLKLPTVGWSQRGNPRLDCDGFFVEVYTLAGGVLKVERTELSRDVIQRRARRDQKRRVDFKP